MRMAGRFARRVKAWAGANGIPVIYCKAGQRKHLIAEEYLETHSAGVGVFMILVAKVPAGVWKVHRSAGGAITRLEKKTEYVYHYSFHIMDPAWGHMVIKMSGHPPWPAQVILNGHEYVAVAAQGEGIGFVKEGNCFTGIADPQGLARVADALSQHAAVGRLGQACDRWIYTACLCFGLDLAEQERSGFRYGYSVYQAEYSRNLLFASGGQMEDLFDRILDRTRSRLDIPVLRTIFGLKNRPHSNRAPRPPAQEVVIEKPQYGLSWFRIRFGMLQVKAYTKGEHVLLSGPGVVWVGGDAQDVHPPGPHLHDEQHLQTPEEDRVHVEEITGQQTVRLRAPERPPGGVRLPRGRTAPPPASRRPGS